MLSGKMKKLFAFMLSVLVVIALFPKAAAAEENTDHTLVGVAAHGIGFTEQDNTKKVKWVNDRVLLVYDR